MVVEVVEVDTQLRMTGVTAAQFNTADQKAAFAQAVEASLSDSAEVMNAVATDVARRRLGGRKLQQNGNAIVVSYTLKKTMAEGSMVLPLFTTSVLLSLLFQKLALDNGTGATPTDTFNELVTDLTAAVTDSTMAARLAQALGVWLDVNAYVAPTTFVYKIIQISTPTNPVTICPARSRIRNTIQPSKRIDSSYRRFPTQTQISLINPNCPHVGWGWGRCALGLQTPTQQDMTSRLLI